jgi:hypothetical protein
MDEAQQFSPAETRLYLLLLDKFNRVGFDRSITMNNRLATALMCASLNSYLKARESLVARGLITVELVTEKRRVYAVFRLAVPVAPTCNVRIESPTDKPVDQTANTAPTTKKEQTADVSCRPVSKTTAQLPVDKSAHGGNISTGRIPVQQGGVSEIQRLPGRCRVVVFNR